MSALFLALFLKSVFKKKMLLLCYFICQIRVGGSGMDMRSKARVTFLSLAIFGNLLLLSISIFDITKSLIYSKSCLSVDSSWTSEWPFGATKVELWWLKHRPSSWWRQWSDLIVRPFLNFYHYFKLIFYFFLLNNLPFYLCSLALKRFSKIRSVEATTFLWVVKLWFSCACSVLAVNDNVFYRFG